MLMAVSALLLTAATDAAGPDRNVREPMVITSSRMDADKLGDRVTFNGDVVLKKEGMTLSADTMIIYYDVGAKSVREIGASGNVMVRKDGRVALSTNASYYNKEEKIVLTGDARIIENENELGGEKITLFMRDGRSIVEGGKVLIYQEKRGSTQNGRKRK